MKRTVFEAEHEALRESTRQYIERELVPNAEKWEEQRMVDRSAFVADPSNGDGQQHGATIQRPSGAGLGGSTVRLAHTGAAVTAVFMLAAVTLTSGLVLIAGRRLRISRE